MARCPEEVGDSPVNDIVLNALKSLRPEKFVVDNKNNLNPWLRNYFWTSFEQANRESASVTLGYRGKFWKAQAGDLHGIPSKCIE